MNEKQNELVERAKDYLDLIQAIDSSHLNQGFTGMTLPHNQLIRDLLAALQASNDPRDEQIKVLRDAIVWALGYTNFKHREDGEGAYWWRKELQQRSGLTQADCEAHLAQADKIAGNV